MAHIFVLIIWNCSIKEEYGTDLRMFYFICKNLVTDYCFLFLTFGRDFFFSLICLNRNSGLYCLVMICARQFRSMRVCRLHNY